MQNLTGHGAADTDVLITFEDFLSGRCGQYEAELAQKQASKLAAEADPPSESVTRVQVDDSGYDMRVGTQLTKPGTHEHTSNMFWSLKSQHLPLGNRAGKRKRVILDESDLRRSNREKIVKPDPALMSKPGRKRKLEQAGPDLKKRKPGRPPGRGPGRPPLLHSPGISSTGPLPAGWSVTLKDSKKEIGKRFKQYKVQHLSCGCMYAPIMPITNVLLLKVWTILQKALLVGWLDVHVSGHQLCSPSPAIFGTLHLSQPNCTTGFPDSISMHDPRQLL